MDQGETGTVAVLGPLVLRDPAGADVAVRGDRQRRLLALLVARAGHPVPADLLIDRLWTDGLPTNPSGALQSQVSRMRRTLARAGLTVATEPSGYTLAVDHAAIDAARFEREVERAMGPATDRPVDATDAARMVAELRSALAVWRGDAYGEFADVEELLVEGQRLDERRALTEEWLAEALLAAGEAAEAAVHLEPVVNRHPLREVPVRLLMEALARSGRHPEALRAYQDLRRRLGEGLGLEPSPALVDFERRLAAGEPAVGERRVAPGRTSRRTIRAAADGAGPADLASAPSWGRGAPLVGRDVELDDLRALLVPGHVVTAVGPGGVGKSRLLEAAVEDVDGKGLRVGLLASLPDRAGPDDVARALGFESTGAAAMVLADAPATIVLDNCEHVLDGVRGFLTAVRPAAEGTIFAATSREPLGIPGEVVTVVPPLGLPAPGGADAESSPAVALFLQRAAAAGAVLVPSPRMLADVGNVCRRLDGLPLAIELAAARSRAVAPSDLLAMVDHYLDVLRRNRRSGERHDSMQAAIDVSVDVLPPDERDLFERLSVFQGPFDLDLAHAVAGDPERPAMTTLDLISSLVDRSLVASELGPDPMRYRLLELLREHAANALDPDERVATEERFVVAMGTVADRLVATALDQWTPDVLARASAQFANLSRATDLALAVDTGPERCFRLLLPMFAAIHEGRALDVLTLGRRVMDRWPDRRAPLRAEATSIMATAAALCGRLGQVEDLASAAVDDPDATPVAIALAERAWAFACRTSSPAAGVEHLRNARRAAETIGFGAVGRELQALEAGEADLAGDRARAEALLDDLIDRCASEGDLFVAILAHIIRARIWIRAGDLDAARTEMAVARQASDAIEQLWWNAALLRTDAALASIGPDGFGAGAPAWHAAVDFAATRGALGEVAITLRAAAAAAQHVGATTAAATLFSAAPAADAITVLPEIFPKAMATLTDSVAPAPAGVAPVEALARARQALTDAESAARIDVGAEGAADLVAHRDADVVGDPDGTGTAGGDGAATGPAVWARDGDGWRIEFAGSTVRLAHRKGLGDLATLLVSPGTEVPAMLLVGGVDVGGDTGTTIDETARRAYEARIRELQSEVDDASADNDTARAEKAEIELDALVAELTTSLGLGGRARTTGSTSERARSAVTYRIRSAIGAVGEQHPRLGRHLHNAVRTGTWCCYQPEEDPGWRVTTGAP